MFPPTTTGRPKKRSFRELVREAVDTAAAFATLGEAQVAERAPRPAPDARAAGRVLRVYGGNPATDDRLALCPPHGRQRRQEQRHAGVIAAAVFGVAPGPWRAAERCCLAP